LDGHTFSSFINNGHQGAKTNENPPVKLNIQYVGVDTARFVNSMLPVYSDELVPPSVNTPPATSTVGVDDERVIQKLISGESSRPPAASACQKGVDCVAEMGEKARPRRPPTRPEISPEETWVAATEGGVRKRSEHGKSRGRDGGRIMEEGKARGKGEDGKSCLVIGN
jgi:hypothetical protein